MKIPLKKITWIYTLTIIFISIVILALIYFVPTTAPLKYLIIKLVKLFVWFNITISRGLISCLRALVSVITNIFSLLRVPVAGRVSVTFIGIFLTTIYFVFSIITHKFILVKQFYINNFINKQNDFIISRFKILFTLFYNTDLLF